jgi:hypothetical protein
VLDNIFFHTTDLPVVPFCRSHFSLVTTGKSMAPLCASRARQEGRFAIVTNVGRGMRWMQVVSGATSLRWTKHHLHTAKSCGPDAATLASSRPTVLLHRGLRRWQPSPFTEEITKEAVKTVVQGMPDCSANLW